MSGEKDILRDDMTKTNIYGDRPKCVSCDDISDVIENDKHYCVDCWYKHVKGNSIEEDDEKFSKEPETEYESDNRKFQEILNND